MSLLVDYAYTTLKRLEDEGIKDASPTDDDKFRRLIRTFSNLINTLTDQVFQPLTETILVDGNKTSVITHTKLHPILKKGTIRILSTGPSSPANLPLQSISFPRRSIITNSSTTLADGDTVIGGPGDRILELKFGQFPDGRKNISFPGTFGRMERVPEITATTTTEITKTTTAITVGAGEAINLRPGFTIDILDSLGVSVRAIIASMSYASNTITIEPSGEEALPDDLSVASGATLTSFGRVPREIERVLLRIIQLNKEDLGASTGSSAPSVPGGPIKREEVDSYSIEYFQSGDESARAIAVTVDEMVTKILDEFTAPPSVWSI